MSVDPASRLNTALSGRYRIERKLGEGGMATVYLARDEKHSRSVALKVLKPELAAAIGGERFLAEIETTANLQHPHILPLFDSGEADGALFYVMPYVDGESLGQRLARVGRLDPSEAVRIAIAVTNALQHAHGRGVVHRDIKPANILIQDGEALVADFGIALAVASEEDTRMTASGVALGTVAYMSPEQATGSAEVDGRSDLYAVGCLLYEMITGDAPFAGKTPQAILARKVVGSLPEGLRAGAALPPTLADVIERTLAAAPGDRYQTAEDLGRALAEALDEDTVRRRTWIVRRRRASRIGAALVAVVGLGVGASHLATRRAAPPIERISVLPPTNLSGDSEREALLLGIHSALVNELSRAGVDVIGGVQSMMRYRGSTRTVREIAAEVGVDAMVESSVFWAGDSIGIDVRLLDAETEGPLWSGSYVEPADNVLSLYRRVTAAIADEMQLALDPDVATRLATARTVDPRAYEAYLRAQFHWNRLTAEDLDLAVGYLQDAVAIDPTYAEAYAGLAWVRVAQQQVGILPPRVATPLADSAATRAMALDDGIPEAHYASASVGWATWDWERAEAGYRRAIELDPNFALARGDYSHYLTVTRRPDEAIEQIERALEIDPFNLQLMGFRAVILNVQGRYQEALAAFRHIVEQAPNMVVAWVGIQAASAELGMEADAAAAAERVMRTRGSVSAADTFRLVYEAEGYGEALGRAADELVRISEERFVAPFEIARMYSEAGRTQDALEWLERGVQAREPNSPYIDVIGDFAPLRDEPRFRALRARMGLPAATGSGA